MFHISALMSWKLQFALSCALIFFVENRQRFSTMPTLGTKEFS